MTEQNLLDLITDKKFRDKEQQIFMFDKETLTMYRNSDPISKFNLHVNNEDYLISFDTLYFNENQIIRLHFQDSKQESIELTAPLANNPTDYVHLHEVE